MKPTRHSVSSIPELFDASVVADDSHHWDVLAGRIAKNAVLQSRRTGFHWLAQPRVGWVAASLLLTAGLVSLLWAAESRSITNGTLMVVLAPADDLGKSIVVPDVPPEIGALLLGDRGGQ